MINLAWGGLKNGQIDTAILVDVSGRGDYLEPTAAAQFLRMRADLHAATGVWINPAPGSSAYRPVSIQEQFYAAYLNGTGPTAAKPVTRGGQGSNHGWARAVDITGYEGNTAWRSPRTGTVYMVNLTVWNWLLAHAAEYGYDWATGDGSGEAWHWESLTPPGTAVAGFSVTAIGTTPAPPIPEETTMTAVFRRSATGEIGVFGADFAEPDGTKRGRHIAASMSDYNGFKAAMDAAIAKGGKGIPELPAIVSEDSIVGLDESGWAVVCRFYGV